MRVQYPWLGLFLKDYVSNLPGRCRAPLNWSLGDPGGHYDDYDSCLEDSDDESLPDIEIEHADGLELAATNAFDLEGEVIEIHEEDLVSDDGCTCILYQEQTRKEEHNGYQSNLSGTSIYFCMSYLPAVWGTWDCII